VLLCDEATASVDNRTDSIIQKMLRVHFADSVVLTIAHRINTILDSDKIMLLSDGQIQEFGSPEELLKKKGEFSKLVKASGLSIE